MTEHDPHGKNPHEPGAKLDAGKNRLALVLGEFSRAIWEVGEVGTYGAVKYTPRGWLEVPNREERYFDAALRHIFRDLQGETLDPETRLSHIAHAVWDLLAVLEVRLREDERSDLATAMMEAYLGLSDDLTQDPPTSRWFGVPSGTVVLGRFPDPSGCAYHQEYRLRLDHVSDRGTPVFAEKFVPKHKNTPWADGHYRILEDPELLGHKFDPAKDSTPPVHGDLLVAVQYAGEIGWDVRPAGEVPWDGVYRWRVAAQRERIDFHGQVVRGVEG